MIEDNKEPRKSRILTIPELFNALQEEYIVFELRIQIYPQNYHRDFWTELSLKKKEKILSMIRKYKEEYNLVSIFCDTEIKKEFYNRIIPKVGFPKFIYSDDLQRLKQEKWDIHNYYMPGSTVSVYIDNDFIYGKIEKVVLPENKAYILINPEWSYSNKSEVHTYDLSLVTRVL